MCVCGGGGRTHRQDKTYPSVGVGFSKDRGFSSSVIWYTSCLFSIRSMSDLKRCLPRIMQFPDYAQSSGILFCFSFRTTWRTL